MKRNLHWSCNTVKEAIRKYFGKVRCSIEVCQVGVLVFVSVAYTDFRTRREVRSAIENISSHVVVDGIERTYSDRVIAMYKLKVEDDVEVDENNEVVLHFENGKFVRCDLDLYVISRLENISKP